MSKSKKQSEAQINLSDSGKPSFFEIEEGSNYKVIMKYGVEEVISFEHFQALVKFIWGEESKFVSVNKTIVQLDDIRMIMPTTEKNPSELTVEERARQARQEREKKDQRKDELSLQFREFQVAYFNFKFGDDWSFLLNEPGKHQITEEDREESKAQFKKENPAAYRELQELELL